MERVSIIMPCYNDGKYIWEAITSVKNQTYKNIELIIIDDGSDDELTMSILKELEKDYLVLRTNHLKPAGARNYGIQHSTGKYILPLDSDDTIDKTYIEKAVKILESDKKIGVVYCEADLFGEKTGKWDLPQYSFDKMLLDNIVFVTALFYKKDWEKVGGYNTVMKAGMEDYDFWISILELEKEIYQISEILFHYRIKKISRTTGFQSNTTQIQEVYRQIYENHPQFYEKYKSEYAKVLREALIDQIAIRTKYEEYFTKIQEIRKIPIIGRLLKKMM